MIIIKKKHFPKNEQAQFHGTCIEKHPGKR